MHFRQTPDISCTATCPDCWLDTAVLVSCADAWARLYLARGCAAVVHSGVGELPPTVWRLACWLVAAAAHCWFTLCIYLGLIEPQGLVNATMRPVLRLTGMCVPYPYYGVVRQPSCDLSCSWMLSVHPGGLLCCLVCRQQRTLLGHVGAAGLL